MSLKTEKAPDVGALNVWVEISADSCYCGGMRIFKFIIYLLLLIIIFPLMAIQEFPQISIVYGLFVMYLFIRRHLNNKFEEYFPREYNPLLRDISGVTDEDVASFHEAFGNIKNVEKSDI